MFNLNQPRTLAVSGAALPTNNDQPILTPIRLCGTETLGELFEYTLELKTPEALSFSPSIAANLDLDAVIGTEVTVSIELEGSGQFIAGQVGNAGMANTGAGTREITGLVSAARLVRETGRAFVYALTIRPWLWLATQNQDCRLFQDMTVVEITEEVLGAYLFPLEQRLVETYPKRDIQRQHWESDFSFVCRLWQEWGIYFWFEHSDGKHRLVLCDSIATHRAHGPAYQTLRFEPPSSKRLDEEHIHTLEVRHGLTLGKVSGVDDDYTRPRADLRVTDEDPRNTACAGQEHYEWGDYAQPQAGAAGLGGEPNRPRDEAGFLARVRLQALRCQGVRAHGVGQLRGLVTGQTFTLTQYPQNQANCEYLVVSSTLEIEDIAQASQAGLNQGQNSGQKPTPNDQGYRYETQFELQPSQAIFRSLCTLDKPRTHGPETAVVVGPDNQDIWTDAYGRVKVQFPWDRQGKNDQRSSCWLRVSSSWQGSEFGATHVPRIGHTVLVDHLNGDPDLPLVTGRLVNAFQLPAWKLPGNQALSGFRSRELGGQAGGRANHLVLDDTQGKIQAQLSSDHALSQLNLGSITRIPGNIGRQDPRGEGFELRTDAHGVVRAAHGMLITTEARAKAQGHAKDMGETLDRLTTAQHLHEALAKIAQQNKAQEEHGQQGNVAQELDAQNHAIRGPASTQDVPFPELSEPHLVLAGRAGIEMATPGTVHIATGQHAAITSDANLAIASGGSFFASVRDTLRLFVQRAGMKLVAAAGDIDLHALTQSINLLSQLEINLTTDTIQIRARKKVLLDGGGSYLKLEPGRIEHGTSGQWVVHASTHALPTPADQPIDLAPQKVCVECLLKAAGSGAAVVPR